MATSKIFLIGETEADLLPMEETPLANEDLLQHWLECHSDLIPGDQIDPENPRRWLLVQREMPVPDQSGGGRWSLDHLFIDQSGIPTFVECKRSADPRARREVVAQMLDYAANGTKYWAIDRIRQCAAETASRKGSTLDATLAEFLGNEEDVESFWSQVENNLDEGRVRLIFVLEEAAPELRRLVEFLNEKMSDVEVLVVELRQFLGHGKTAVVPRVIGMTEAAREKKTGPSRPRAQRWDEDSFFAKLADSNHAQDVPLARRIVDIFKERRFEIQGGRGRKYSTLYFGRDLNGTHRQPFNLYEGSVAALLYVTFPEIDPVLTETQQSEFREMLRTLGYTAAAEVRYPGLQIAKIESSESWEQLTRVVDWVSARLDGASE